MDRSLRIFLGSFALAAPLAAQEPVLVFDQNGGPQFGFSVDGAGDVDRDSISDFVVGQPEDAGRVVLYSGFSRTPLWVFRGNSPGDGLGATVAGIGDANGDGFDDVAASAPEVFHNGASAGQVYIVDGATGQVAWTVKGDDALWRWGEVMDGAGDINADGYDDVIVASKWADTNGLFAGIVRVYSGRDGAVLREHLGNAAFTNLGSAVSAAGDVNHDGFDDYMIGAEADDAVGQNRGSVTVHSGADGSVLYHFDGEQDADWFGSSVDGGYDVNGDGIPDFMIGAQETDYLANNGGSVYVYSGADGAELFRIDGPYAFNAFGIEAAFAGDLNGDGLDDLMIGDPKGGYEGNVNLDGVGYCHIHSGADGSLLWRLEGEQEGDRFAQSVAAVGDLNADGIQEILIGAPAYLSANQDGYVQIYQGTQTTGRLFLGVTTLHAGMFHRAFVILATPRTLITTYYGFHRGPSTVPGLGRLDIRRPQFLHAGETNGSGTRWIGFWVPAQWAGRGIWMQSVDSLGNKSLPLFRLIQ